MGPAQPWQYKMGETTLFWLCQPCPHTVRRSCRSRNCCRVPALMQGHPREKFSSFHPRHILQNWHPKAYGCYGWLFADTCAFLQIGSKTEEEKQQQQPTSQPKVSWLGASGSGFMYSTLFESYTHTTDTTTEQHRGRERAAQALGSVSRGHQTVQVCGYIPHASSQCWSLLPASNKKQKKTK